MAEVFREDKHPRDMGGRFRNILGQIAKSKPEFQREIETREGLIPDARQAEKLQDYVDKGTVSVRMFAEQLAAALKDEKFKNIHEAQDTNGMYDPKGRAIMEKELWGDHPVYGYIAPGREKGTGGGAWDEGTGWYGDVKVELKDEVKDRTTVTDGDTLMSGMLLPSPARKIDPVTAVINPKAGERDYHSPGGGYIEAHIFGDVTSKDIQNVTFTTGKPAPAMQKLLKDKGISWTVDPNFAQIYEESHYDEVTSADRAVHQKADPLVEVPPFLVERD